MRDVHTTLAEIWPYDEIVVPPQLAALPLEVFFSETPPPSVTAATWQKVDDPEIAPRASYALRLTRRDGMGQLACWTPYAEKWRQVSTFPVSDGLAEAVVIELNGILLGNVDTSDALRDRVKLLIQRELGEMTFFRLTAMVFSITSIMTLFFAVRIGLEMQAPEPFALVFALAVCAGMTAAFMKGRSKLASEKALARVRQQFQYEYRANRDGAIRLATVNAVLRDLEGKREEMAVAIGFLLLLCLVYFVSPLLVVSVIVALIIVTLMTGNTAAFRGMGIAFDRAEQRLAQAVLSFRSTNDSLATPALRSAKKQVLRERLQRHGAVRDIVNRRQGRRQLGEDLSMAIAFAIIFGSYALVVSAGLQKLSPGLGSSLVSTSMFSVAPIIILISITRSTTIMAKVVNRQLATLTR